MQQTRRGERKGGRKRKKEKVETPEEMAYRLFHSRSSTPTTTIFLQVLPGKLEIRGSLTRGNRGKIDRLADTMARERGGGRIELMKKSCAIVRGRWRGTIDFYNFFFLWILIYRKILERCPFICLTY